MHYYNYVRSHGGHCNKGLLPVPSAELYEMAPGDHLGKLIHLGIIKLDDEWPVRLMGSDGKLRTMPEGEDHPSALPFAFVLQRRSPGLVMDPDHRELGSVASTTPPQSDDGPAPSLVLAK